MRLAPVLFGDVKSVSPSPADVSRASGLRTVEASEAKRFDIGEMPLV
jgi:hypothetical protein